MDIQKGDRVGMLLQNCVELMEIDVALSRTGIARIPLNDRLGPSEHSYILNNS